MKPISISMLTICGLEELEHHSGRAVTHVLSILDPDCPDPGAFRAYDRHHRTILRFHDIIEPIPEQILPEPADVEAILAFGRSLGEDAAERDEGHLLVHCHAGISRSTAAMAMLLAQVHPDQAEKDIFERLLEIRPQAWPNSRMIGFADDLLARDGRLTAALARLYRRQLARRPDLAETMRYHRRGREIDMAEAASLA
ncbi:MAG TPA: protein-tyrosine phosphatase family protein [Beijerinckiaceae bacterium]|nr:protein-tyrosine phosphatase family protein [Beijerinckiaceae bacterium]